MQFTTGGPDVPERLLQAHEDGRVVFFCGAGISYPARLPGFKGLVERLYEDLHIDPTPEQAAAIGEGRYDTAIGLLEEKLLGGRQAVGDVLVNILTPDLTAPSATATHHALLTLGGTRDGRTRLITTNFDRLFHEVIASTGSSVDCFRAPLLPIPKRRWNGLVYLHGLLTEEPSLSDFERLVLTSGDFGLAYLTERWAARFVSELFRIYNVCFVGYSLSDPVLRYMADALAADRRFGESAPEMFAFGVYSKGQEAEREREWKAKNVTPILYKAHWRHAYLHKTLRRWAETYRDGARGKERIVVEYAMVHPLKSTKQDDFVTRMLWALADPSGLPAKRFAELDPVPPLDWFGPLSEKRFRHGDLNRFRVTPNSIEDTELAFSLTSRPPPYTLAPWMTLADTGSRAMRWDEVMWRLARWLTRHLDDPALLLQLVKLGGRLHENLARMIDNRIGELTAFEHDGKRGELDRIRANARNAIPRASMRTLWRLLLTDRVRAEDSDRRLHAWKNRFERDGLTATLRLELRELLTPRVLLSEPFRLPPEDGEREERERIRDLVEWKVVLPTDMVRAHLSTLTTEDRWKAVLPELLQDFNGLLHDALDLMRELGGATDKSDLSYVHQPSISDHPQNRGFHDWTALIEWTRDAWLATCISSPDRARIVADIWWQTPYPLFRRLALFAATQSGIIPPNRGLEWLLADGCWWLWSSETSRESIRLLVSLAPRLDDTQLAQLEQAIEAGPPREMFRPEIEPERWTRIQERDIWLRLSKVVSSGAKLSKTTRQRLTELSAHHPDWKPAENERDEFSTWMSDSGDWRESVTTPRDLPELTNWLRENQGTDPWHEDDWAVRCREDLAVAASALSALAKENIWPTSRWGKALHVWSEDTLIGPSWRLVVPVLVSAPKTPLKNLAHDISWWLEKTAKTFEGHESTFFELCDRVLALDYEDGGDADDVVGRAINHPVGRTTEALLGYWYRASLEDEQGLHDELRKRFALLCDTRVPSFRHGRVLLAAHVIALFRVDRKWTAEHLLPLFGWSRSEFEARSVWGGFLWSPQLYRPLVEEFKQEFLDTASHYEELGQFKRQYASLLTFAALGLSDVFTNAELAAATRALPQDGLEEAAEAVVRAIEGAGDQRAPYWTNRVKPYVRTIWPKTHDRTSPAIAESLGRVCIAAGDAFPGALTLLHPWLQPVPYADRLVHSLHEAGLSEKFPRDALELLDRVIGGKDPWPPNELRECLCGIRTAESALGDDRKFVKLSEYLKQCGEDL